MHWLRRVAAETRIFVLVVFLALFQALLLSVFGLTAIRSERRQAEENLVKNARSWLDLYVVAPAQNQLQAEAEAAWRSAFEEKDHDPLAKDPLFLDVYEIAPDGSVAGADGLPLYEPPPVVQRQREDALREAKKLATDYRTNAIADEADKSQQDLAFALRNPFLVDDDGDARGLLSASTPMLWGDSTPTAEVLLKIRWAGVLNRVEKCVPERVVKSFLERVDRLGGEDATYVAGKRRQDERERLLVALLAELPFLSPSAHPALHRSRRAGPDPPFFYVRRVGKEGPLQVLALGSASLTRFLDRVAKDALAAGDENRWKDPRIVAEGAAEGKDPVVPLPDLPGYVATTHISESALRAKSWSRERFYWYIIGFSVAGMLAGGFWTARVVRREIALAKLKSGFVSNVSHELKTPLTSIQMFSDMLRSGQVRDDRERAECLEVISQESTRLGKLIQRVLDFSRLEARRRRFRWVTGSLAPLVEREAERFRRTTGLDDKAFTLRIAVNLPSVRFDPEAFGEVLTNLLSNAYKYTPPGRRRIEVTLGPHRGRVLLAVEDNGEGVPPHERRKVFEQFYRGGDYLNREVEGTGLGLSIARSIVRAHGGRIFVEEGTQGGSRFVVVLPAVPGGGQKEA